ncbi:hypothetical protein GLOIN_2v1475573 [Rhizophagus irregularis DAOM 181602=DAOM 197198]|uniref:Uncharacterized protein n=1 Tax=Rhizophagus irregularis (strain DAOM 181602 / DAOM 197198 / MUCL 43194) TaxID=747089 RepID=A0A2P4QC66_RHIID|nr:hypothetical protein GLOIN_2v1475573 [Rhizophagus irregularis DAOM 181602=DAOM 197198]POG75215.1 hypothetical protein GLOIN_2v1475573 [Rhizophagus irregularis DAOM 181602=DAOM 197198]|eukprot:XP_025182081.1 hypothetical protein GLOIN_2v1475573 [Rhizophagus irregularis DAOM 181602=DAOM 197198]
MAKGGCSEIYTAAYQLQYFIKKSTKFYGKKLTLEEHECQKMFELEEKKLTQQYELEKSKLEIEKLRAENGKVKLAAKKNWNNGTSKGGSMHDKQKMDNNEDIKAELTKITNKEMRHSKTYYNDYRGISGSF